MNKLFFDKLKDGFWGIDGGNINSDLWISGLEWGGENSSQLRTGNRDFIDLNGMSVPCKINFDMKSEGKSPFDQKTTKIILASKDEFTGINLKMVKDYIHNEFYSPNGDFFKLNLFPLNCKNIGLWTESQIEATGCSMKYQYFSYSIEYRFPFLRKLVIQYNPKIIVCYGSGYMKEFMLAFWGEVFSDFDQEEIALKRSKMLILRRKDYPILVITPFPGRNLSGDDDCIRIGKQIGSILY